MPEQTKSNTRGWIVVLAGLAVSLVLGTLYAWGVMAKALVQQWQWSKMDASLPFAIATAMFAMTMVFAGRMQDIFGPRLVAILGGVMFGLGLALSAFTTSPWIMVITFGVCGGMGIGLANAGTTPAAVKWFPPSRKGLVSGIVVGGVGIAAIIMAPLTKLLLDNTDIPTTFLILGVGAAIAIILLAQLLKNPPVGHQPVQAPAAAKSSAPVASAVPDVEWREMLRTKHFYTLWIIYVLGTAAGLLLISNIAVIAHEQASWEDGFVAIMILAIFNTAGRFGSGAVSDRIGRSNTMIIVLALQAINMFAFAHYTSPAAILTGCAIAGICYGALFPLLPAATADFYGLKNLGVNYGLVFTAFGVAGVWGSLLGGRIRDMLGSYSVAYIMCSVMLIVAALLAMTVKIPKKNIS
jgi:MFS transporter, OFA family, oxalate/formate antiporter